MELQNNLVSRLGQPSLAVSGRRVYGGKKRPGKFWWITAFLCEFLSAQAAPIQLMSVGATSRLDAQEASADGKSRLLPGESFGRLPLLFEAANSEGSAFRCRGLESHLWLSPTEAVLTFS